MNTCPAPTEQLTIEQILSKTYAVSQGEWVASIAKFNGVDHFAVGVAGSTKAVAVFGACGESDELDAESIANAELFQHAPRLHSELITLREQESEDLAQARAEYDRSCEKLTAIRSGMIALYDRYQALHICAQRYLQEWANEVPKGWSLDELEACLEMPLPKLVPALDPDLACQQREEIEDWVIGCKGSLYAVVLMRLLKQGEELACSEGRLALAENVLRLLRCAARDWDYTGNHRINGKAIFDALAKYDSAPICRIESNPDQSREST